MKMFIVILSLLAAPALAQTCAKIEFAELDAMPKEELLRMRCDYTNKMTDPQLMQAGRYGLGVANRCAEESARMDRIIARKYQLKNRGDDSVPYFIEVSSMCQKI